MAYNGGAVVLGVPAYATAPISILYPNARRARAYYEQVFAAEHVATRVSVSQLHHLGPLSCVSLSSIAMRIAGQNVLITDSRNGPSANAQENSSIIIYTANPIQFVQAALFNNAILLESLPPNHGNPDVVKIRDPYFVVWTVQSIDTMVGPAPQQ